jgi:hypothetical protein
MNFDVTVRNKSVKMFEPNADEITGIWSRLDNGPHNNTHFSHNFITVIKMKNDEVCGKCMHGGGDDKCINSSVGIAVRKRPPGDMWMYVSRLANIITDIRE